MGTDIHCVFQKKNEDGTWTDVPSHYEENRHYALFAWLGNVRNGHGFAGIPTHNPITPLQDGRGLPEDFEVTGDLCHRVPSWDHLGWRKFFRDPADPVLEIWMGDHSFGWLDLNEILNAQPPTIVRTGIVDIDEYHEMTREGRPPNYSWGAVSGKNIEVNLPNEITEDTTHVRIQWLESLLLKFADFLTECKRLTTEHGTVRMVFGFDS